MKSILEELYYGNICPAEQTFPANSEYRQVNRKIGEIKEYFLTKLSPEDKEKFEQLSQLNYQSMSMELTRTFVQGVQLATRILIEIYNAQDTSTSV